MKTRTGLVGLGLFTALLYSASCSLAPAGPMLHDSTRIGLANVKSAHINLNMGGGDLKIGDGAETLLSADFDYNVPEWKPSVDYNGTGDVTIRQGSSGGHIGRNQQNKWSVQLNRDVPMEILTKLGGGDATLNLGGLTLRLVDVEIGAGNLNMDLRGSPKTSYDVQVRGGAGDATIHLPDSVGIDATATGGIGDISTTGLHEEGHRYTNDALGKSPVTIHLSVEGGVGSIHLDAGK